MRRYLFGKEVHGSAFVVFGVMEDKDKKSLPHSLTRVEVSALLFQFFIKYTFHASKKPGRTQPGSLGSQVTNGEAQVILKRDQITQTFPNINTLVGKAIFVSASVLTDSGE